MKIGIIGAGSVGGSLGRVWSQKGHFVVFGVRELNSEKVHFLLDSITGNAKADSIPEAAVQADVVVIATPWEATQEAIAACGDLTGKILIDCTNPLAGLSLAIGFTTSGGEQVASWAKNAKVYKAFHQTGWENMANPTYGDRQAVMFVCGDDEAGKSVVLKLVEEIGFEAIDVGKLTTARLLEPYALLWIQLAVAYGQGRNFAFTLVRR